jgi:hypothetical protein
MHFCRNFDFIGIVERFAESMVVLAYILRVALTDVISLNAKESATGGKDDLGFTLAPHPPLAEEPEQVQAYVPASLTRLPTPLRFVFPHTNL